MNLWIRDPSRSSVALAPVMLVPGLDECAPAWCRRSSPSPCGGLLAIGSRSLGLSLRGESWLKECQSAQPSRVAGDSLLELARPSQESRVFACVFSLRHLWSRCAVTQHESRILHHRQDGCKPEGGIERGEVGVR